MKISNSAKDMYLTCSEKYNLHYNEKLRSTFISSPLMFGSAFDDGLNVLLLQKKKSLDISETLLMNQTPEEAFTSSFAKAWIVDQYIDIAKSEKAMYFKSDLDLSLLEPKDHKEIFDFSKELEIDLSSSLEIEGFIEECQAIFKKGQIDVDSQKLYNYICWLSLRNKGLMLLDGYRTQIMPQIEEVFSVQKQITLSDQGDELTGFLDFVCSFYSEPGVKYVCDNKTSSRAYSSNSVANSEQLAIYAEHEGIYNCAYIVIEKKLRKRKPRVRCSIIKDKISDNFVDKTFDNMTEVLDNIKDGKFSKNFDACYSFGQKCPYYDFCRTKDLKNLKYTVKETKNGDKEGSGGSDQGVKS